MAVTITNEEIVNVCKAEGFEPFEIEIVLRYTEDVRSSMECGASVQVAVSRVCGMYMCNSANDVIDLAARTKPRLKKPVAKKVKVSV